MAIIEDGGPDLPVADYTYLGGEPTQVILSPERIVSGTRMQFRADVSQVVFSLTAYGQVLAEPSRVAATAGRWAAFWNAAMATPGVTDIAESQEVRPLGALYDAAEVAVVSTSGLTEEIITLRQDILHIEYFQQQVAAQRARLDAIEAGV